MKVLVANRGEIAVRVIRALKEMDLGSAAVYSEEDKDSPHRALADESWCIGPAPAKESYLHAGRIITAAKLAGAGAIHPGYGFLAENDAFAGACEKAGITFIGPKASVMKKLADKLATKNLLEESGVPVIPGGGEALSDVRQAALQAETAGYPVLLKAVFGGGGRGITLIRDAGELNHNFEIAKSESKAAFGKDLLYMEKFLDNARHIEVQTAADIDGHAVAFTERDCTIQRRNQKLLEESPSPFVGEATRQKLLAAASAAVQTCGLTGLATVEFLLMPDRQTFYFMEINKRIQVEHPVTEELLGIDLVAMQISLAMGSGPAPQPHSGGLGRLESHREATSFGDGVGVRGPGGAPASEPTVLSRPI
ncbi:MAG: ATP-grasp domain-containing protein [Elusimicrobia bacterium]|nr:ATP-grasp domain-containing protein [Elusimicrobiota bacterium]